MAHRTITINSIVESIVLQKTGKTKYEFKSFEELIDIAAPFIFDDYPIFNEEHRVELNRKILSHYYFREIVTTPFSRWKHFINDDLKLKMPYYNKLYEIASKDIDLFNNVDYTETLDRDLSGTQLHENSRVSTEVDDSSENRVRDLDDNLETEQSSKNDLLSSTKKVMEDTPYSQLGNIDYATEVNKDETKENENLSQKGNQKQTSKVSDNNTKTKSNEVISNSDNTSKTSNTEDYVKTIKGKNNAITNSELMMLAKKAILNVDEEVIEMLSRNFSGYFN